LSDDELSAVLERLEWLLVPGGETLIRFGDPSDGLYLVNSGRLAVSVPASDGTERLVREVGRSATVGGVALVTGQARTATVRAVRDSVVGRLSATGFEELVDRNPGLALAMTRVIAGWLLPGQELRGWAPATIAVVPLGGTDGQWFATTLAGELGTRARVLDPATVDAVMGAGSADGSGREDELAAFLDEEEATHALVVYIADPDPGSLWTRRAVRQADLVLAVADAALDPAAASVRAYLDSIRTAMPGVPMELVLVHSNPGRPPRRTGAWLEDDWFRRHCHVRSDVDADWRSLARHLTGTAVGLVLSGGGARGFAHIGALRAFEEADFEIDRIGGTSMGALIGALWSCGHSADEIIDLNRRVWLGLKPTRSYTFPVVALLGSRRIQRGMFELFGDARIEDQWQEYFCTSTNLTRNLCHAHHRGLLRRYVLASMSMPGIVPPTVDNGDLLVDGGVLNNLPTDLMRDTGAGTVIAVDVSPERDFNVSADVGRAPGVVDYVLGMARGGAGFPNIFRILERTSGLTSGLAAKQERLRDDVRFIAPPVAAYDTFAMKSLDEIIEVGYQATVEAMATWPPATPIGRNRA
jgi:NTE family protein